jgi:UDP-N-acetylmuramyl tripeptide synthase
VAISDKIASVRLAAAVGASRILSTALRKSGRSGGTAAPGIVALAIDPGLIGKLAGQLPARNVVIAGTNGKTTTSRLLADIVEASGATVIHNRSGSNLSRGVAAAFAGHSSISGQLDGQAAVIESDEAALPEIIQQLNPDVIVLNNLFRDQLDRYGELDTVARQWRSAFETLDGDTTLVVNADDPSLASITEGIGARRITFGLSTPEHQLDHLPHAVDAATCRKCGSDLHYQHLYLSHLGDWYCPNCGNRRPVLDVAGENLELHGARSLSLSVRAAGSVLSDMAVQIPGVYNAYNVTAAVAAAAALGVDQQITRSGVESFRSPFGRAETVKLDGRDMTIALVKNPVGFNEVLRLISGNGAGMGIPALIAINDETADGRDVSWLWDVDFEVLARGSGRLYTTGIRGADMANRLKYAGVDEDRIEPLNGDLEAGLREFIDRTSGSDHTYILPTYTALLGLRQALARSGAVEDFWRQ